MRVERAGQLATVERALGASIEALRRHAKVHATLRRHASTFHHADPRAAVDFDIFSQNLPEADLETTVRLAQRLCMRLDRRRR